MSYVGHKSNSQMSHTATLPHSSRHHSQHMTQPMSQSLRRRDNSDTILFVKDAVPRRSDSSSVLDSDVGSTKSGGRRPSVDTVSTYLSHDSELRASTSHVSEMEMFVINLFLKEGWVKG